MSLLAGLTLRVCAVALVCLGLALAWAVHDVNKTLRQETTESADRAARQLKRQQWLGSAGRSFYKQPFSARQAMAIITVIGPGICIDFSPGVGPDQRLCSGWDSFGPSPPSWFGKVFAALFDPGPPARRPVLFSGEEISSVVATADRVAAMTWAWSQLRILAGLAAAIAAGMSIASAVLIARALSPIEAIVRGLRRLECGDFASRLPAFRISEFRRIGEALNAVSAELEETAAERRALTRRLLQVQEDERKALARELHDEFGQCLTAVGALAASIEAGSPGERSDLAEDARRISGVTMGMMATLRGAFARLRPPDLDELGLEASLRTMLRGWDSVRTLKTRFSLEVEGDLSAVPSEAALSVYRIAQECITNAARHGAPSHVSVRVRGPAETTDGVALVVEDNGGGHPDRLGAAFGFGIAGIKERVAALGGTLSFGQSDGGLRMSAFLPLPPPGLPAVA